MPEDSEEDESFEAGSDEGDSDDESVDAEDGVTGVRPRLVSMWSGHAAATVRKPSCLGSKVVWYASWLPSLAAARCRLG